MSKLVAGQIILIGGEEVKIRTRIKDFRTKKYSYALEGHKEIYSEEALKKLMESDSEERKKVFAQGLLETEDGNTGSFVPEGENEGEGDEGEEPEEEEIEEPEEEEEPEEIETKTEGEEPEEEKKPLTTLKRTNKSSYESGKIK